MGSRMAARAPGPQDGCKNSSCAAGYLQEPPGQQDGRKGPSQVVEWLQEGGTKWEYCKPSPDCISSEMAAARVPWE